MPTNYPGNRTATQAPSAAPSPEGAPVGVVPIDGEALNAASIAQAIKVAMDYLAFALKPRAKASAWAEGMMRWRSAQGNTGFGVDHLGFPAGRLQHWRENWLTEASFTGALGQHFAWAANGWLFWTNVVDDPLLHGCSVMTLPPERGGVWERSRYLRLQTGDLADSVAVATRGPLAVYRSDLLVAFEWDAVFSGLVANDREVIMGLNSAPQPFGGHAAVAQFRLFPGSVNWGCETDDGTTVEQTDSGVASVAVPTRFRVEYHGASVDDAGVERVLFMINGAVVGNHTARMPSAAISSTFGPYVVPFFYQRSAGISSALNMGVTPLTYSNNLYPGDVF